MDIKLNNYFNRFDPNKNYEEILIRDGYAGQGAEINELQTGLAAKIKKIADVLFKDGDVIRDAAVVVDASTGAVQAQQGQVYLNGAVRTVPAAQFSVPTSGTVAVGVYMQQRIVTELEDPSLYNPAIGSAAEGEAGAARLQLTTAWGYAGDGQSGEFFAVYVIDDGVLRPKETPPNLDAVTQALADYDRDATGGSYIVEGLTLLRDADVEGKQVYTLAEGRARVNGYPVTLSTSRRLVHKAVPEVRSIDAEGHLASGSTERVTVSFPPIQTISRVAITKQGTESLTHGSFAGCADTINNTGVLEIISVTQGETTYTAGSDFVLTGNTVDWSPTGAEPATGSTYNVTYKHLATVQPQAVDATGFTVSDAVAGTLIQVSYSQMLPRIDTLTLDSEGSFAWLTGVATTGTPRPPLVPSSLLGIASVYQTWTDARSVSNDGDRVVPNGDILAIAEQMRSLGAELARQRLESNIAYRESGMKKGLFVDPFLDDTMRDQGVTQTAAIVAGELTLPVEAISAQGMGSDVSQPQSLPHSVSFAISQPLRTGSMQVNPYQAFALTQGAAVITPAIDRWTVTKSRWTSPATIALTQGSGNRSTTSVSSSTRLVGTESTDIAYLRPIAVNFSLSGFGARENLARVLFDSIEVNAE
ncbi:MAG: DUF4815 domain-containing protein [Desulfovibrionaceae bacterium]|nr:DUF4815 domain-containing protein [Desulfovibrionaceae bacterium]